MPNLQRLLKRRPVMDEAEMEEFRARALARLSDLHEGPPPEASADAPPAEEAGAEGTANARGTGEPGIDVAGLELGSGAPDEPAASHAGTNASEHAAVALLAAFDPDDLPLASAKGAPGAATVVELPAHVADVMADLVPTGPDRAVEVVAAAPRPAKARAAALPASGAGAGEAPSRASAPPAASPDGPARQGDVLPTPPNRQPAARPAAKLGRAGSGSATPRAKRARKAMAPIVTCPYCALLLLPPPTASRRCPRCRQRIVVKRAEGRTVYLAEAVLPIFEAEQQRIAAVARWSHQRGRWLELAALAGARADHMSRLEGAPLTDTAVAAARKLYMTTLAREVKAARHDRRWGDASTIRLQQARVLFRLAGSPVPPPHEIVALHREGASLALRDISELARDAELVGSNCCAACRADDGRIFRISRELRTPRLPHADCPKGLCRCQWSLAGRDRTILRRHRRRPPHTGRAAASVDIESTA
ncbi:MAG: hypothetical protein ACLQHS_13025 [Candidatus Limnocylindrales bacterium]